ncbi:MAG: CoA transferase [Gemmatimonadota bacterium]|nr:CoA transferase [Gemmatimonadota bacterium]
MRHKEEIPALAGLEVVTTALNLPGPLAAAELARMGAGVLKVEPPAGDPLAEASPGWYEALHEEQEVVALDLTRAGDRATFDGRLAEADLLLTSSRPASLSRLGLGWGDLRERFPGLSRVAIVGHPSPREGIPTHDLTAQAEAGLVDPPDLPRSLVADLASARRAVALCLELLLRRERGQAAAAREVAMSEEARAFAEPVRRGLTSPDGPLGGGLAAYGVYRARDGWIAVAALEPRFRERLEEELGWEGEGREGLERIFRERPAERWERWAEARDLPLVAVRCADGSLAPPD